MDAHKIGPGTTEAGIYSYNVLPLSGAQVRIRLLVVARGSVAEYIVGIREPY